MPIDPDYVPVAERIAEFRDKHPDGSLQPVDLKQPYKIEIVGELAFIVYAAAAYRTPTDKRPGIGLAWEPFPGPTNFTRNSELQNAETSAWGRAIVAALAADTNRGVATAEEVRNREQDGPTNQRSAVTRNQGPLRGPDPEPTSAGNERRGPQVMDGWADAEEQRAAHEAFTALAKVLGEEEKAAMAEYRAENPEVQGWPLPKAALAQLNAEMERQMARPM